MIVLTRLNGPIFALNPDLIERVEANPDTVVVLVGGARYSVAEPVEDVVERIRTYRGQVIAAAHAIEFAPSGDRDRDRAHDRTHDRALRVIPLPDID
ncbi:MAG: flagellar protein FlbD [Actinomycetota bacterium]|jgi:flagellar protein FlbD|nr:flagellar protein FlbD [Actinomycetota bacterium]